MYCPRCGKTIKRDRIESLNLELKSRFGVDALEKGTCPVCGTALMDIAKIRKDGP